MHIKNKTRYPAKKPGWQWHSSNGCAWIRFTSSRCLSYCFYLSNACIFRCNSGFLPSSSPIFSARKKAGRIRYRFSMAGWIYGLVSWQKNYHLEVMGKRCWYQKCPSENTPAKMYETIRAIAIVCTVRSPERCKYPTMTMFDSSDVSMKKRL